MPETTADDFFNKNHARNGRFAGGSVAQGVSITDATRRAYGSSASDSPKVGAKVHTNASNDTNVLAKTKARRDAVHAEMKQQALKSSLGADSGNEDFFNPYHGPDGRFTSGGGKALRRNLAQLKAGKAGVRKNAAEAGHAGRKGDATSQAKNAHATKINRGKAAAAMTRVREQRAAQIALAKRKLGATSTKSVTPARPKAAPKPKATTKQVNEDKFMGKNRKSGDIVTYGKRHLAAMDVVSKHKTAKATPDKKDDGPAARNLAKMRQKQIANAKKKSAALKA
jgi:hypothetical protein